MQGDPTISEQEIQDAKSALLQLKLKLKGFNDIIKVQDKNPVSAQREEPKASSPSKSPNQKIKGLTFRDQIINIISQAKTPDGERSFSPNYKTSHTPIHKEQSNSYAKSQFSSSRVMKTMGDQETSEDRGQITPPRLQQHPPKINFSAFNFASAIPTTLAPRSQNGGTNTRDSTVQRERQEEKYSPSPSKNKLASSAYASTSSLRQPLKGQIERCDSPKGRATPIKKDRKVEVSEVIDSPKTKTITPKSGAIKKQNTDLKSMKISTDSRSTPQKQPVQTATPVVGKADSSVPVEESDKQFISSNKMVKPIQKECDVEALGTIEDARVDFNEMKLNPEKQSPAKKVTKNTTDTKLNLQKKTTPKIVSTPQNLADSDLEKRNTQSDEVSPFYVEEANQDTEDLRVECPEGCGRKFAPEAVARHAKACVKIFQTKRKKFDMASQRMNEDQANLVEKKPPLKVKPSKKIGTGAATVVQPSDDKQTKWKQQSEVFRANLKQARGDALTKDEEVAMQKDSRKDDMIQCEYCLRRFNDNAAQRHIPFCKTKHKIDSIKKTTKAKPKKN